jgi:hypothetical protein
MNRELLQQALTVLKEWDALIKYQYLGTSEAMTDMQYAAWNTMDAISALEAELSKPINEFNPDWDQQKVLVERICELEAEYDKLKDKNNA